MPRGIDLQRVPRRKLIDARKHGAGARQIAEGQIFRQDAGIELSSNSGVCQDGFDFGSEQKCFPVVTIIEGFNSKAVSRRKQGLAAAIPYRKGEHPAQIFHAVAAVLFIQVDNRFRVASRAIAVATGFQFGAQLHMVIDFTVEDDPKALVLIRNRLMASLYIDDAEPPHGKSDIPLHEKTVIIGAAMGDLAIHGRENATVHILTRAGTENAADSTHN